MTRAGGTGPAGGGHEASQAPAGPAGRPVGGAGPARPRRPLGRYWASVGSTGDDGDVLWDPGTSDEADGHLALLDAHADTQLPVVDVGCGNGRFTRALATRFPSAVGLDRSAHAVARTNHRGSLLAYLETLGARPTGIPTALGRAISTGLPRPSPFGAPELADTFPTARWDHVHTDGGARISTVPIHRPGVPGSVPGFLAVLRPRGSTPAPWAVPPPRDGTRR